MKTHLAIITSFLLSVLLFSGCQSDKAKPADLQEDIKEMKLLAERSENLENKKEAFDLMKDLNQNMKDIRDKTMEMDMKYRSASENEKEEMERKFEEVTTKIDKHLGTIKKNIEPYEEDDEVAKMIEKLNEILISK